MCHALFPHANRREHRGNSAFLLLRQSLKKGAFEMYTGYQIYQSERPRSAREQREIDMTNARLVAAIGRFGRSGLRFGLRFGRRLARPVRPRRQTWRPAPGRPAAPPTPCPETSR
jgi:hypothetical protein